MSWRFKNTSPVKSWVRFFNPWKNGGGNWGGCGQNVIEETKRLNPQPIPQQNKSVDKTTNIKQLKCDRI